MGLYYGAGGFGMMWMLLKKRNVECERFQALRVDWVILPGVALQVVLHHQEEDSKEGSGMLYSLSFMKTQWQRGVVGLHRYDN